MSSIHRYKNSAGFTLVEIVLTIVVVSIGLFGMMFLFDNVTRSAMDADMSLTATYLARERLEGMVFDKAYRGYDYVAGARYPASESVSVGGRTYTRNLTIREVDQIDLSTDLLNSGFKRIDIVVMWGNSSNQQITETTLVAR